MGLATTQSAITLTTQGAEHLCVMEFKQNCPRIIELTNLLKIISDKS